MEDARNVRLPNLGYPVIIRAAYALGGLGSGFCDNEDELNKSGREGFLVFTSSVGGEEFEGMERGGIRSGARPVSTTVSRSATWKTLTRSAFILVRVS